MADKTTGLTAEEAQAALPGQDINQVCHVYVAREGAARTLYDLPTGDEVKRDVSMAREEAPSEPEKAAKTASKDNEVAEGAES